MSQSCIIQIIVVCLGVVIHLCFIFYFAGKTTQRMSHISSLVDRFGTKIEYLDRKLIRLSEAVRFLSDRINHLSNVGNQGSNSIDQILEEDEG